MTRGFWAGWPQISTRGGSGRLSRTIQSSKPRRYAVEPEPEPDKPRVPFGTGPAGLRKSKKEKR